METLRKLLGLMLMMWITSAAAKPDPHWRNEVKNSKNIVGISTQIIANALIQGQAESTTNYVFSPIGYATILSILGFGSNGETRNEIFRALELPLNSDDVRTAYRTALEKFTGNDSMIAPQFKTWFYIYRNNTVEDEFRNILAKDFLVEVKDIDRFISDFDMPQSRNSEQHNSDSYPNKPTNSKDIVQFDELMKAKPKDPSGNIDGFETLKSADHSVPDANADYDEIDKEEKKKVSKFDREVDDKQYEEVSKIKEKLEKEHLRLKLKEQSEGPEKITLPFKKYFDETMEIMDAQENRNFAFRYGRAQPLYLEGDVTSALSGNSIVGRKGVDSDDDQLESKMLLFNGLYFRGNWAQPFMELRSEEGSFFHASSGKQNVKFMKSQGQYKIAEISSKNLLAVELPYENERYALLVVMPKSDKHLIEYSKHANYDSLNEITSRLETSTITLSMPKFRFECTSRAEKHLAKIGLTTLFTSKADLSGITKDAVNYRIEELVQHVAVRVDEGSSSENSLSAGNVESRNIGNSHEILINRPFVFYVRDVEDDLILAAGKITEIPVQEEIPISFN